MQSMLTFIVVILFKINCCNGYENLCSLGGSVLSMNGNWTYIGYDSLNENMPYWEHNAYYASIEWGYSWSLEYRDNFVIIDYSNTVLAYCGLTNTDPFECDNNWIMADTDTVQSHFIVGYCSYFTV